MYYTGCDAHKRSCTLQHLDEDGAIQRLGGNWAIGNNVLKVTYAGAYATTAALVTAIPDVAEAAAQVVSFWWYMTKPSNEKRLGIASRSVGGGSVAGYLQSVPTYLSDAFAAHYHKTGV